MLNFFNFKFQFLIDYLIQISIFVIHQLFKIKKHYSFYKRHITHSFTKVIYL